MTFRPNFDISSALSCNRLMAQIGTVAAIQPHDGRWTEMIKTLSMPLLAISAVLMCSAVANAVPQKSSIELVPHRAVYDLSLRDSLSSSNVADLRGRLVLDFSGSPCAGYSYKSRLVTQLTNQDGGAFVTDMRTSTWEDAEGEEFRFENSEYVGFQPAEIVSGSASREGSGSRIAVEFKKPAPGSVEFDQQAMFPTQHSIAILEAAQRGKRFVQADVFDGSEQGKKLYSTTTFIGRAVPPAAKPGPSANDAGNGRLSSLTSWPISISFYDGDKTGPRDEGLPTYELAFRLYANGVSGDLTINYGDFLIGGELTRIDFSDQAECASE